MKCKVLRLASIAIGASTLLFGCSDDGMTTTLPPISHNNLQINLLGNIEQEYVSRADDSGFTDGDRMGVFIVDYQGQKPGTIDIDNNRAFNLSYTYEAASGLWSSTHTVYWRDESTPVDVYGYYPYDNNMLVPTEHTFSVETDQSINDSDGEMGSYERSDFLWAKITKASPTNETLRLSYSHRMAGAKVTLWQGSGFEQGEWDELSIVAAIDNTQRDAVINLTDGSVTPAGKSDKSIKMAKQLDDSYRAIIVPQTLQSGMSAVSVTIDGTVYKYKPTEDVRFIQGKITSFELKIDKKAAGGYTVTVKGVKIIDWENDASSHGFEVAAYTIIDCPVEGTLAQRIAESGKDVSKILNLKITGRLNNDDFDYIRETIPKLTGLNIADVITIDKDGFRGEYLKDEIHENVLPNHALLGMSALSHIILPTKLVALGELSLAEVGLTANSTLVIPTDVKALGESCLSHIERGNLVLPSGLVEIDYLALSGNGCNWEYNLGNTVKHIGRWAFNDAKNCFGRFQVPPHLEYLGDYAFCELGYNTKRLTGDIEIPEHITSIPRNAFEDMGFANGTNLTMHDNITYIDVMGFYHLRINNFVSWPSGLKEIGSSAFSDCKFLNGFGKFPDSLSKIGKDAFRYCEITAENIEIPQEVSVIPSNCFSYNGVKNVVLNNNLEYISDYAFCGSKLESIKIGKYVENIGVLALSCKNLSQIICLAPEPPRLGSYVFSICDIDHLILEVPEASVPKYRNAEGWNAIKYITPYHELAMSVGKITCLDKGIKRNAIVRSEGSWSVESSPSWCHLSQTSSKIRTTEITITVDASTSDREGEIVLRLDGTSYTTSCTVKQMIAAEPEDKEIVLQQATSGHTPIPVFIVGDGFDAQSIVDGTYMECMRQQMEYFFAIEPYKTYRDHFTVSTALAVSPESGIGNKLINVENRFNSVIDITCSDKIRCDYNMLGDYARTVSSAIDHDNMSNSLIMVVLNQNNFIGDINIPDGGPTFALNALSSDPYPYDTRGLVQYYAGGAGFGRLAYEGISHIEFLQACTCPCCNAINEYRAGAAKGWYKNISLSGSLTLVPWGHLIFDPRYSDIVDIFEGGWNHARGAFRSENLSCMSAYIQYYNTISRELIVRRIMELSGQTFDFETFVSKDSREGCPQ